jgi:hypothetical protein
VEVSHETMIFQWTAIYIVALNLLVGAGIGYFRRK